NPGNAALARLLAGTGTVAAEVERAPGGALLVRDLNVAFPNLTITGSAEGDGDAATARFDARLADVGLFAPDFSGPATASGTATLASGTWTVDAALTGPGGTNADVSGSIGAGGAMNLAASGTAPLGLANAFLEPRRIGGTAGFDLRLTGAPSVDNLSGSVSIAGADLRDPTLGIGLTGIGGTIALSDGRAVIDLGGEVEAGGRIGVSGGVGLTGAMQ